MRYAFKIIIPFMFFCAGRVFAESDNESQFHAGNGDTLRFRVATVFLKDGTRIWGLLESETQDTMRINDFNAGKVAIARERIKNIEIQKVDGPLVIETINGTSYNAEIVALEEGALILSAEMIGVFKIQANTISRISYAEGYVNRRGNVWFANPNATRYFFAPSAIPLKKREGYFQNVYLLANSVSVGVTDNFTVGGGVVIPLLFYVTPKISFKVSKNLYLGGGLLFTQSFISDFGLSAGIGYGLATYGTTEHNLTTGAGYGFAKFNNEYKSTPGPIVTVNGMTRIAKKLSHVTENWLIPRAGYNKEVTTYTGDGIPYSEMVYDERNFYSGAVSVGLRFMPGVRASVDFSVVGIRTDPGQNELVLPYLDFVYKFN